MLDHAFILSLTKENFNESKELVRQLEEHVSQSIEVTQMVDLLKYLDLTSLNDTDTEHTIINLYEKGLNPVKTQSQYQVASLCVYPLYVPLIADLSKSTKVLPITTVDTSFPHGKLPIHISCCGIKNSIANGADEIDIVIDRGLILSERWQDLYNQIASKSKAINEASSLRKDSNRVVMKTIISVGDLPNPSYAYIASRIAILAGTNFLKTSTGKESKATTPEMAYALVKAIRDHYDATGEKIGFKVAGGVKTVKQAIFYRSLVHRVLGEEWLNPFKFRIGASSLLDDILKHISQ